MSSRLQSVLSENISKAYFFLSGHQISIWKKNSILSLACTDFLSKMVRANSIIALVALIIILSVIFAVCFLHKSNVIVIKKARHYPDQIIVFDEYSFRDDRLEYLVCDKDKPSKCQIVHEKLLHEGNTKRCDVRLEVEGDLHAASILIVPFEASITALLWEDDKSKLNSDILVRISIVNLKSCMQTKYREYSNFTTAQFKNTRKIVPHEFDFDIFYENSVECHDEDCQLHIRYDGSTFERENVLPIQRFNGSVSNIHAIANAASEMGFVFIRSHDNQPSDLCLVQNGVKEKVLTSLSGEMKMAVVNSSIGICSKANVNSDITCSQFNVDGKSTLNVTVTDLDKIDLQSMYTLPGGGLLLVFIDFQWCQENAAKKSSMSNYFILKLDADGKEVSRLRFQGVEKDCNGFRHSYVYKKPEKEEYCVVVVPPEKQSDKFDILVNCFPMSDFDDNS